MYTDCLKVVIWSGISALFNHYLTSKQQSYIYSGLIKQEYAPIWGLRMKFKTLFMHER